MNNKIKELKEIIYQLEDLKHSQELFITGEDTEIFEKDVEALDYAINVLKDKKDTLEKIREDCFVRHCNECGKEMWEGYCIENGLEYYCSDECLHKNIDEDLYNEMYDEGNGDSYYTDWFEEQEYYNKLKEDEKYENTNI